MWTVLAETKSFFGYLFIKHQTDYCFDLCPWSFCYLSVHTVTWLCNNLFSLILCVWKLETSWSVIAPLLLKVDCSFIVILTEALCIDLNIKPTFLINCTSASHILKAHPRFSQPTCLFQCLPAVRYTLELVAKQHPAKLKCRADLSAVNTLQFNHLHPYMKAQH